MIRIEVRCLGFPFLVYLVSWYMVQTFLYMGASQPASQPASDGADGEGSKCVHGSSDLDMRIR